MPINFCGPGARLSPTGIATAAKRLGCLVEAVQAVVTVETGGAGGFLADGSGRPRILFEAKHFGDATGHEYDATHPCISCGVVNWKLYRGGAAEYERLDEALALDEPAALSSASWGLFQVLGSNAVSLGYASVQAFVGEMVSGEDAQLEAFVRYVITNHLDDALEDLDWARFARGYNGPSYALNRYDVKLADAFALAAGTRPNPNYLRLGSQGANVRQVQLRLVDYGFRCGMVDGIFGKATEYALRKFQSMMGIQVDGIAGPETMLELGLEGLRA